jgi:FAD/FMN-containing dehydrogenase
MLEAPETVIAELDRLLPDCVHPPGSEVYLEGLAIWNGAVSARPAAVVRPQSSADVQATVRFAMEHGVPMTVRGGGHDWAGRALNDGGLVIDLADMRRVTVDPTAREAVIEGGATSDDVVRAAESHGLTVAAGTVGAVGMVGFTLGGGYGPLNGVAGLGVDNLLEAEVVLSDGRSVLASAANEPTLFWALRGGGGNFGVVIRMRVRLHPFAAVTTGVLMFRWTQATDVLRGYDALVPTMPDHLTVQCGVISDPHGQPALFVAPTWVGDPSDWGRWMGQLSRLASPLVNHIESMPPSAQLHLLDDLVPPGRHYELRTVNVAGLSPDVVAALVEAGSSRTSAASAVSVHHCHGASTRVDVTDTAFGIRAPHFMVEIIGAWETGDGAEHQQWAHSLYEKLMPHALPGGYPNLIGPAQRGQANAAYGPNSDRLLAAKERWDGANIFAATPLPGLV